MRLLKNSFSGVWPKFTQVDVVRMTSHYDCPYFFSPGNSLVCVIARQATVTRFVPKKMPDNTSAGNAICVYASSSPRY